MVVKLFVTNECQEVYDIFAIASLISFN